MRCLFGLEKRLLLELECFDFWLELVGFWLLFIIFLCLGRAKKKWVFGFTKLPR